MSRMQPACDILGQLPDGPYVFYEVLMAFLLHVRSSLQPH